MLRLHNRLLAALTSADLDMIRTATDRTRVVARLELDRIQNIADATRAGVTRSRADAAHQRLQAALNDARATLD